MAGPSLVGGVLVALALPPFGWWPLAVAGAALLWWRLGGLPARRRLVAGVAFGLGWSVVSLWWVLSFNVYGGALLMVVEALAPALAALVTPGGRGRTGVLAGAMVLAELGRSSWPFGGLPLGGVALSQAGSPLGGAARLGGPLLLVGLVWLAGGGVGSLVVALAGGRGRAGAGGAGATGVGAGGGAGGGGCAGRVGALLSALVALGAVVTVAGVGAGAPDGGAAVARLAVAAVQGGGQRGLRKADVDPATVFGAQVAATQALEARTGPEPRLVLWPEDVVALDEPLAGSSEEAVLASLAEAGGTTVVAGVTEPAGTGHFRNEIVAFAPDGAVVARFDKVHRVPFGEYVPLRGLVQHLADLSAVPQDAVAGHGTGLLRTPAAPLGAMVSYEVFFADRGRSSTRAGAELLVVPTNTSSYATAQVPTQEIAAARLQALAEGRDLVQAAPTGFSAVVDHDGHVLARTDLGRRQVLTRTVALRRGQTVYERLGDAPVLVLAAVGVLGSWVLALRRRRGGGAVTTPRP